MKKDSKLFVMCLAIGLLIAFTGCASGPKAPITKIHDPSVPEEEMATLFIPPGNFEVTHFNGEKLLPPWITFSTRGAPIIVKFPSRITDASDSLRTFITWNYYNDYIKSEGINSLILTKPGRNFLLYAYGNMSPSTAKFFIFETSQTIEPNSNEQVLYIKNTSDFDVFVFSSVGGTINLNSGYRSFLINKNEEIRIILPKGENTFAIANNKIVSIQVFRQTIVNAPIAETIEADQWETFNASSDTFRYSIIRQNDSLKLVRE